MCSLHLTHPSAHTWSSGQPTAQRQGSSRGLPAGAGIRTHNLVLQVQRAIHKATLPYLPAEERYYKNKVNFGHTILFSKMYTVPFH